MADPNWAIDNIYVYNHENSYEFALDGANSVTWEADTSYYVFGKGFTENTTVKVGNKEQTAEFVSDGCLKVTYDSPYGDGESHDLVLTEDGVDKTLTSYITDFAPAE